MLTIKIIDSHEAFNGLRYAWDELLHTSGNNGIFLTWQWLSSWLSFYQGTSRLLVVLGHDEKNALVGIAPLMIRQTRLFGVSLRSVEFIGSGPETTPDHLGFIALPAAAEEFTASVFNMLMERSNSWDIIHLRDMDDNKPFFDRAHVFGETLKYDVVARADQRCPFIALPGTWEEFLARLSKKWRYRVKTYERELTEAFPVDFSIVDNPKNLDAAMEVLESLHRKRMQDKKLTGISTRILFWDFHKSIARALLAQNQLFLGILKIGERVIACNYAFVYANKVSYYQSGLDPEFKNYSAGFVLNAFMIRESIQRGMAEFDFLRGDEPYKFHLTAQYRENRELFVWNSGIKGIIVSTLFRIKERVKSLVSKGPISPSDIPADSKPENIRERM